MAVHALADGDMPCTQSLATRVVGVVVDLLLCTFWSVLRSSMNMVIILKRHVSASLGWVSGDGAGHLHVIATTVVNKASAKKKALSNFKSIDLAQFIADDKIDQGFAQKCAALFSCFKNAKQCFRRRENGTKLTGLDCHRKIKSQTTGDDRRPKPHPYLA